MLTERARVRKVAVGLAVAAALATSACAAGQVAETAQEKTTLDGTNVDVGGIALRGLAIETPDAATYNLGSNPQIVLVLVNNSTSDDQLLSISSSVASGWGTFASAAALTAATAPTQTVPTPTDSTTAGATPTDGSAPSTGSASSTASAPSTTAAPATPTTAAPTANAAAPISLTRGVAVRFGVPAADGRILALLDTKTILRPGASVSITFRFAKAGSKTVTVPIRVSASAGSYTNPPSFLPSSGSGEG